jgi:hypothetical protein
MPYYKKSEHIVKLHCELICAYCDDYVWTDIFENEIPESQILQ